MQESRASGPVKKATVDEYLRRAKLGPLSANIKNHCFGDTVVVTYGKARMLACVLQHH